MAEMVWGSKPAGQVSVPYLSTCSTAAGSPVASAAPVSTGAGVLLVPPPQPARTPMSMAPARDRDSHFFMFFM